MREYCFVLLSIEKNEGGRVSYREQWELGSGSGGGGGERVQGELQKETSWQHKDRNKDNGHKAGC